MSDPGWRAALEAADAAIVEFSSDHALVRVAPASLFGDANEGLLTYDGFLDRLHPDDRRRVDENLRNMAGANPGATYRDELRTLSGAWLTARGKVVADETRGKRLVALLRNDTERRRVDEARLRAIHELSLSSRSAEIFVSMIAHDLKNPIGAIMGTAHMAIEGLSGPPLRRSLERIRANSARLTQMIQHIRDYARGRTGGLSLERRRMDLRTLLDGVIDFVESKRDVELEVHGETTGTWDAARLEHALSTLLEDSVSRAPPGTKTRVRIDGTDARAVALHIMNDAVLSPESVENAFRPFGANGTEHGLGLFAARLAVVAHGGDITVTSAEGEGTSFHVKLPRDVEISTGIGTASAWDELAALEASPSLAAGVTASLFGALPLYEREPGAYWKIYERYAAVFDDALNRRVYRGETRVSEATRAIAEALGAVRAGAQEVAEIHARALKQRLRDASPGKAQALVAEGRLLAFEVMGHLVTWYRSRAVLETIRAANGGSDG